MNSARLIVELISLFPRDTLDQTSPTEPQLTIIFVLNDLTMLRLFL
jgi:hypothetical protein